MPPTWLLRTAQRAPGSAEAWQPSPHLGIVAATCTKGQAPDRGRGMLTNPPALCQSIFPWLSQSFPPLSGTLSLTLRCHQSTGGLHLSGQVSWWLWGRSGGHGRTAMAQQGCRGGLGDGHGGGHSRERVGTEGAQGEEMVVMARALGGHSGGVEPPRSPWDGGAVGCECEWVCGAGRLAAGSGRACLTLEGASVTGKGWAG